MIRGVIFDVDGVLIDSESCFRESAKWAFGQWGHVITDKELMCYMGSGERRCFENIIEANNIKTNIDTLLYYSEHRYLQTIHLHGNIIAGAQEFIDNCLDLKLKLALASGSRKEKVLANLSSVRLSRDLFDYMVTGEECNPKPDPQIFCYAADGLGLMPNECLVVEDSINGVTAAKDGGFKCLALLTNFSKEQLSRADYISKDLRGAEQWITQ